MIDLSICIATFNRARFLGETLENILGQAPPNVEVLVVDGASSDDTPQVVADVQRRHPALRYQRQEANGGVDRDFDAAVSLARGTYCWLFSDDDVLKPGAIAAVLAKLGDYALIIVNAEVRDAELRAVLDPNRLRISTDEVYTDDERLLAKAGDYLTFIGGVVIRRDLWLARNREAYFGSLFIHFGVIFQEPLPGPALLMAEPRIVIRYGNAMWTSRGFEIWMFKWPQLVWSTRFGAAAKERVTPREPWRSAARLLIHRAIGSYSPAEYERWLPPRLIARIIALLPGKLVNALALAALAIIKRKPTTTRIDLLNSRWRR
jgi:glycosyltransferase involved in cell wall biosynthesis